MEYSELIGLIKERKNEQLSDSLVAAFKVLSPNNSLA